MKIIWKWILGILGILVLVGALFAVGYFWRSRHNDRMVGFQNHSERVGPQARGNQGFQHPPINGRGGSGSRMFSQDGYHQMTGGHGGYGYDPGMGGRLPMRGGSPLEGLLHFIVFIGLLYGAYWLGRHNARIALDPKPIKAVAAPPAPEPESPPSEDEQA